MRTSKLLLSPPSHMVRSISPGPPTASLPTHWPPTTGSSIATHRTNHTPEHLAAEAAPFTSVVVPVLHFVQVGLGTDFVPPADQVPAAHGWQVVLVDVTPLPGSHAARRAGEGGLIHGEPRAGLPKGPCAFAHGSKGVRKPCRRWRQQSTRPAVNFNRSPHRQQAAGACLTLNARDAPRIKAVGICWTGGALGLGCRAVPAF